MQSRRFKKLISFFISLTLILSLLEVAVFTPPVQASGGRLRVAIIDYAYQQVGKGYRVGAEGPDIFDCSGLVWYCYRQAGVKFSRSSSAYYYAHYVDHIGPSELWPGDLVFKQNTWRSGVSHVGIYVGGGQVIEARGSKWGVVKTSLSSWTKSSNWAGAGRVKAKYWPDDDNSTNIPTPEFSGLTNRSFEKWSRASYVANSYGCQAYGNPGGRYLKLNGGHTGNAAQSILTSSNSTVDYREVSQTVGVQGGSQARIGAWASSNGQSDRVWLWAIFLDEEGRTLKTDGVNGAESGVNPSGWTEMVIRTSVPDEVCKVQLIFRVQGQARGSQTNWDDWSIKTLRTLNPSFEGWSNGPVESDGFVYHVIGNPGGSTFRLDGGHSGASAQAIRTSANSTADFRELSQDIPVVENIVSRISVWVSSNGNNQRIWMWATFKGSDGRLLKTVGANGKDFGVNPDTWKQMSMRTSIPEGATQVNVMLRVQGQGNGAQTNWDDLSVAPW